MLAHIRKVEQHVPKSGYKCDGPTICSVIHIISFVPKTTSLLPTIIGFGSKIIFSDQNVLLRVQKSLSYDLKLPF